MLLQGQPHFQYGRVVREYHSIIKLGAVMLFLCPIVSYATCPSHATVVHGPLLTGAIDYVTGFL